MLNCVLSHYVHSGRGERTETRRVLLAALVTSLWREVNCPLAFSAPLNNEALVRAGKNHCSADNVRANTEKIPRTIGRKLSKREGVLFSR